MLLLVALIAVPSGSHPRLFMDAASLTAYRTKAAVSKSSAHAMIQLCEAAKTDHQYDTRGGSDGDYFPGPAVACAFAYKVETDTAKRADYLATAIKFWRIALENDQTQTDGLGCTAAHLATWNANTYDCSTSPAHPAILTVAHDTTYPIRWFGNYIALTYDWLQDAPGVADLPELTRGCLTAWNDFYTKCGYNRTESGANYNAGYIASKALSAVALHGDAGVDGHLWTEIQANVADIIVAHGLASPTGANPGNIVGGDWPEGFQYGPLSVLEYAATARVLEENGAAQPEMNNWVNALFYRYVHGSTPDFKHQWCANGDNDEEVLSAPPNRNFLDAVLIGHSSDAVAGYAAQLKAKQFTGSARDSFIWNALAEIRSAAPTDYLTTTPPLSYIARGTRTFFTRSAWDATAFFGVFQSSPANVSDHIHLNAGNFQFTRGADDLIGDPAPYGTYSTLASNAPTLDSATVSNANYAPSQTPWSKADLVWARSTKSGVHAARGDYKDAFYFQDNASDITFAKREWVMLPEGEIVIIDRALISKSGGKMYLTFNTNTGGGQLTWAAPVASGPAGSSKVAIHRVSPSAITPTISAPDNDCSESCSYPCGICDPARVAVDRYRMLVPGPWATAVHVIDGLGASENAAEVSAITDPDMLGAIVTRGGKRTYVVASSKQSANVGSTLTYAFPAAEMGTRHVVYDAPEAADGTSSVTAEMSADKCVISVTAGSGGGFAGHPVIFEAGAACALTESESATSAVPPDAPSGATGDDMTAHPIEDDILEPGCHCRNGQADFVLLAAVLLVYRSSRRRHPR